MNELFQLFPDMKPISKPPTLQSVNGFGTSVYGRRDFHEDTGTYVKTQYVVALFIPIAALASYRVLDAPGGGWYFLGRVPVSGTARLWNWSLLVLALCLGGWFGYAHYVDTPDYRASQQMAKAEESIEAGQYAEAARIYQQVAAGTTSHAAAARNQIQALLDNPAVQVAPAAEVGGVFQVVAQIHRAPGGFDDVYDRGLKVAADRTDADPAAALAVLQAVADLAPDADAMRKTMQGVLEQLVKKEPDNLDAASRLASLYFLQGQRPKCEAILKPFRDKLGDSEGARILGTIYADTGKVDEACLLLQRYVDARLPQLQAAEAAYEQQILASQQRVIELLKSGQAPGFAYAQHQVAGQAQQQAMVNEYLAAQLRQDADLARALEAQRKNEGAVVAALELGMARLQKAQNEANPDKRKDELDRAEKTFLAIRGQAGETDQFKLQLGQVYYWMGRQADGRKLFDEVLVAGERRSDLLVGVANLLRNLGAAAEARELAEEGYQKEADVNKKYAAAKLRALTSKDLDDRTEWLKKCNQADPDTKASLASSQGYQALRDGKEGSAADHFREAANIYAAQPENPSNLNNGAVAWMAVYSTTGDPQALASATRLLEKALELMPGDSIVMSNLADALMDAAMRDVIGVGLDLRKLKASASLSTLGYLYADEAGRSAFAKKVKESPKLERVRKYNDRLLLLAPQNVRHYSSGEELLSFLDDLPGLQALARQLEKANPDRKEAIKDTLEGLTGKNDERLRRDLAGALTRNEAILKDVRAGGGPTFAAAADAVVQTRMSMGYLGDRVDADAVVKLAEEAHTAAPSSSTSRNLQGALMFRAHEALKKQEPAYAVMNAKAGRALSSSYLIPVALSGEGKARDAALANADVKRAITLVKESAAKFPDHPSEWSWAMLKASEPEAAAKVAVQLRQREAVKIERAMAERLSPADLTVAFRNYWALEAEGKDKEARDALKRCGALGVPLPFDVP